MKQNLKQSSQIYNLPRHLTLFVGRSRELSELTRRLANPACRLLTLVGPGGTGKTRLAIEVARQVAADYPQGITFVPLQGISSPELLTTTLADALNITLSGADPPQVQLLNYLRSKKLLLILDNFEQLLEGRELLTTILEAAPGIDLLLTSREVMNLHEEWLYPVTGLTLPPSDTAEDWAEADAVQLFAECARRVRWDFSLEAEGACVVQICRLVEGMPLALELAASWLKTLTCGEISVEIQRNLDFLTTSWNNIPERHRSMRAVFDYSWQRLSETERHVFRRLSIFQGGFRRAGAEAVAGANLSVLAALVDKSLLRWEPDQRRYQIHELLRQYAAEQLAPSPEAVAEVQNLHCNYYALFLHKRFNDMVGGRQKKLADEIEIELENIRAAWRWAVEQLKVEALQQMVLTLVDFFQIRSRYPEGASTMTQAAERLRDAPAGMANDPLVALILTYQGGFYIRLGQVEKAEAVLTEAQALYQQLDLPPAQGHNTDPALSLGIIALIRGDYAEAARQGEQARQTSETHKNRLNQQVAYYLLARAALGHGNYEQAQKYAQRAYTITQQLGNRWFMAYCLNELGSVAYLLRDYEAARGHYEASYTIRQEFEDAEGMALALLRLSEVAFAQEDYTEAGYLCEQSRRLYQQIGDRGGLATALSGLGRAAIALGDHDLARQRLGQALELALEINYVACLLTIFYETGKLFLETGQIERGLELLALVQTHPAGSQALREQVQQLFQQSKAHLAPDLLALSQAPGEPGDLESIGRKLHSVLAASPALSPPPSPPPPARQLLDPLSERELEVLHLVAAGLKNREIATELIITLSTVKAHINNIYGKLEVNNRVQAVARARELDLL